MRPVDRDRPRPMSLLRPADENLIRPVSDEDSLGMIELIGAVWLSYPGIVFDVDAELPELKAPAGAFASVGGAGWVAERSGQIVGCVGVAPSRSSADWELLKLYVAADQRRQGLARRLTHLAEDWARGRGAAAIELWSDTRFIQSHAFYRAQGYAQDGERRLQDLSRTTEFRFYKRL